MSARRLCMHALINRTSFKMNINDNNRHRDWFSFMWLRDNHIIINITTTTNLNVIIRRNYHITAVIFLHYCEPNNDPDKYLNVAQITNVELILNPLDNPNNIRLHEMLQTRRRTVKALSFFPIMNFGVLYIWLINLFLLVYCELVIIDKQDNCLSSLYLLILCFVSFNIYI